MTRPGFRLTVAALMALGGAWLVGWWLVGVVLIVIATCLALDAFFRDDGINDVADSKLRLADEVLERYRRAR